jgi:hypothetical protein
LKKAEISGVMSVENDTLPQIVGETSPSETTETLKDNPAVTALEERMSTDADQDKTQPLDLSMVDKEDHSHLDRPTGRLPQDEEQELDTRKLSPDEPKAA